MITGRALTRVRSLAAGLALAVLATVAPALPGAAAAATAQQGLPDATTVGASPGALPPVEQTTVELPTTDSDAPAHPRAATPATTTVTASGTTHVHAPYLADYSTDPTFSVGTYNGGANRATAFLNFDTAGPALTGRTVLDATLWLFNTWSYSCAPRPVHVDEVTTAWSTTGLKSWPGPERGPELGSALFSSGYLTGCAEGGAWQRIPLDAQGLTLIQSWAEGAPNHGLAIRTAENDSYSWKKFAAATSPTPPRLEITTEPATPAPQPDTTPDSAKHNGAVPPRAPGSTAATTPIPTPHVDRANPLLRNETPQPPVHRTGTPATTARAGGEARGDTPSPARSPRFTTWTAQEVAPPFPTPPGAEPPTTTWTAASTPSSQPTPNRDGIPQGRGPPTPRPPSSQTLDRPAPPPVTATVPTGDGHRKHAPAPPSRRPRSNVPPWRSGLDAHQDQAASGRSPTSPQHHSPAGSGRLARTRPNGPPTSQPAQKLAGQPQGTTRPEQAQDSTAGCGPATRPCWSLTAEVVARAHPPERAGPQAPAGRCAQRAPPRCAAPTPTPSHPAQCLEHAPPDRCRTPPADKSANCWQ
ncbi:MULTISPECIES: DNRLRE domain-containing protein [Actinosynnema]|uniref:DNRLRE domain-containing protein n=1 Tax=Actinosynnema TaxID=40566 RepID=UPI003558D8BF|nr:hypothetical protein [Actinosynnema pretiosum]